MKFSFRAGTSRGVLTEKDSWFIFIKKEGEEGLGIGEVSIIPRLSIDDVTLIDSKLHAFCKKLSQGDMVSRDFLNGMPAVRFGIESALKDIENGGKQHLYTGSFVNGNSGIPINGLIWMDTAGAMMEQVKEKLEQGFRILKFKVGAIDFEEELALLRQVRNVYSGEKLEIRLDANGAWEPDEAIEKLKILSELDIHSLEQPIKAGRVEAMAKICKESPIDIALDEELIGIEKYEEKLALLQEINPPYIILKPSLLGGMHASEEWIDAAGKTGAAWWVTSALESNIGLNAIAQWTSGLGTSMPQGLGTGGLFTNNIPSPLIIKDAKLWHNNDRDWDFSGIKVEEGWS